MSKKDMDEGVVGEVVSENEPVGDTASDISAGDVETLLSLNALYADKIKSQAAEFENFRNRTAKEMGHMRERAVGEFVLELLPIIDNFELALKNADTNDGFAAGMLMIQNQMLAFLERLGVSRIETIGKSFDIKYHSAVSHIEDANLGENTVADELQAGYIHKDTVIRHAVVVVAN